MPYLTGSQRYSSPPSATPTHNLANLTKNMGRYQGAPVTASVIHKRPADGPMDFTRRGHPLPCRPQQPAYGNYGFQSGGFGREAGRDQTGYGGYSGYQQPYRQQAYQRQPYGTGYGYQQHYGQQESQGQHLGGTHWQQQGWQGAGYPYGAQAYQGTGYQYGTQGYQGARYQGISSQGSQLIDSQQPTAQYSGLPPTTPANQAWQAEYFRQYQQYAHSLQNLLYQQFVPQGQTSNQHGLTEHWQTVDNADTLSTTQLNANAAAFTTQAPPLKYARTKPNAPYATWTSVNGSVPAQQASTSQRYKAGTQYGRGPQRSGPAANTRSFTMTTESSEAQDKNGTKFLLPRPDPTPEYMTQATKIPQTLPSPRPLLVVLDLNGTLLFRTGKGGSNFKTRPYLNEFLQHCLKNHYVMVWSSAKPANVDGMCKGLLSKEEFDRLVSVWSRDHLRLGNHYNTKVQVYKQLSWVWNDLYIQAKSSRRWSQADTVLIDDSIEKAASEPHNIIQLEEFEAKKEQMEFDVLGQVVNYLEVLKWEKDVSAYMQSTPFQFDVEASFDWTSVA